jgi:cell division septum initiation protein DivIVA
MGRGLRKRKEVAHTGEFASKDDIRDGLGPSIQPGDAAFKKAKENNTPAYEEYKKDFKAFCEDKIAEKTVDTTAKASEMIETAKKEAAAIIKTANDQALEITNVAKIEAEQGEKALKTTKIRAKALVKETTRLALDIMLSAEAYKKQVQRTATDIVKKANVEADQTRMDAYADIEATRFDLHFQAMEILHDTELKAAAIIAGMKAPK